MSHFCIFCICGSRWNYLTVKISYSRLLRLLCETNSRTPRKWLHLVYDPVFCSELNLLYISHWSYLNLLFSQRQSIKPFKVHRHLNFYIYSTQVLFWFSLNLSLNLTYRRLYVQFCKLYVDFVTNLLLNLEISKYNFSSFYILVTGYQDEILYCFFRPFICVSSSLFEKQFSSSVTLRFICMLSFLLLFLN